MEGYKCLWDKVYTVWSSPNYCFKCGNKAAWLKLENGEKKVGILEHSLEVTDAKIEFSEEEKKYLVQFK